MKLVPSPIPDVVLIQPTLYEDERGWFYESFNELQFHHSLQDLGLPIPKPFVQDNHSYSKLNVLRGLHYQLHPAPQGKLVRVVKGAVFDVAVDLRASSATFGQYTGIELNAVNKTMLWIPEGFAHGFLTLEEDTHFLYKTTHTYHPAYERTIVWNDPTLAITWPIASTPLSNEKDRSAPLFDQIEFF